jgi:hypothetical protein
MKWEYNKVSSSCELTTSKLNELDKESWELVSVMQTASVKYIGGFVLILHQWFITLKDQ